MLYLYLIFSQPIYFKSFIDVIGKCNDGILLFSAQSNSIFIVKNIGGERIEIDTLYVKKKLGIPFEIAGDEEFIYLNTGYEIIRLDRVKKTIKSIYKSMVPLRFTVSNKMTLFVFTPSKIEEITRNGTLLSKFSFNVFPKEIRVRNDTVFFISPQIAGAWWRGKTIFVLKKDFSALSVDSLQVFLFTKAQRGLKKLGSLVCEVSFPMFTDAEVLGDFIFLLTDHRVLLIENIASLAH